MMYSHVIAGKCSKSVGQICRHNYKIQLQKRTINLPEKGNRRKRHYKEMHCCSDGCLRGQKFMNLHFLQSCRQQTLQISLSTIQPSKTCVMPPSRFSLARSSFLSRNSPQNHQRHLSCQEFSTESFFPLWGFSFGGRVPPFTVYHVFAVNRGETC